MIDLAPIYSWVSAGQTYGVRIDGKDYTYQSVADDNLASITSRLAARIDADAGYTAVADETTYAIRVRGAGTTAISGPQVSLPTDSLGLKALSGGHINVQVQSQDLTVCEEGSDQSAACVTTTGNGTIRLSASGSGGDVILHGPVKSAHGDINVTAENEVKQPDQLQTESGTIQVSEEGELIPLQGGLLLLMGCACRLGARPGRPLLRYTPWWRGGRRS
jgi:hypothetical protein